MTSIEHRIHLALRVCENTANRSDRNQAAIHLNPDETSTLSREARAWVEDSGPVRVIPVWVLAREALGLDIPPPDPEEVDLWSGQRP